MSDLDELLDQYFDIGVREGREKRDHDDTMRSAELTREKIRAAFNADRTYPAALAQQPLSVPDLWQTMDTAPTDGTRILAVHENGSDIQITWFGKTSHVPLYGWCEGEDAEDIDLWRPTHWQPLPAAPTVGGKE